MAHFKDIVVLFIELLFGGGAVMQIADSLDSLLKEQEKTLNESGLTASHEEFLFWFNIVKLSVIFFVVVSFYLIKIYFYFKKHKKEHDK